MTSIITKLEQFITPEVLQSTTIDGDDAAKRSALTSLYQLLVAGLTGNAAVKRIENYLATTPDNLHNNGDELLAALLKDDGGVVSTQKVYDGISAHHKLPTDSVRALAAIGLPLAYQHIKTQAGVAPIESYLAGERDGLIAGLPTWLVALLPTSLLGASAAQAAPTAAHVNTTPASAVHKEEKKDGSFMKALLPIIGALILAALAWALLKACQKDPTPIAAPVVSETTPQGLTPATLSLALNETGQVLYACDGVVGNAGLAEQLRASITGVVAADACQLAVSSTTASDMPAAQYLPQILGFMKGVPDATVNVVGKTITLNASNADALNTLVNNVSGALPADFTVTAEPVLNEADAIANSLTASMAALDSLTASSTVDDLVRALNLQIINFTVDSTEIPVENQAILDKAATRLMALPNAHLVITGHTDNTGSMEYNQDLSERRAKAVHDYLVAKGVDDAKLEYAGASFTRPVASNATEQGRFKNRRIAFTIYNEGEQIANVGTVNAETTSVVDGVANTTSSVVNGAANAATTAAQTTTNAIGTALDVAGNAVNSAATTAGQAVESAGQAVNNATTEQPKSNN